MAAPACTRCPQPVAADDIALVECQSCGGPIADDCARCGNREVRGEELRRCIGCGDWLCTRSTCSRPDYENLARRVTGRVCASCLHNRREIVPRQGTARGAGSAAGVEAVERARFYLAEAGEELEERVRRAVRELEAATERQLTVAGEKLGRALEDALARGLSRGARLPLVLAGVTLLVANAAIAVGIVMALR